MPSRRRSASTSPRRVHAAACRTIRSFSAAVKDRRLPGFGSTSTATPLGRAAASGDAGAGVGWIDRRWDGLGTGQVQFSALCTQITRRRLSHSTLAQRVARFAERTPVSVMVRGTLEYALAPDALDALFRTTA